MKKIILSLALMVGLVGMAKADSVSGISWDVVFSSAIAGSSGTVFTGPGVIFGVWNSTGNNTDYSIGFDTVVVNGLVGLSAFQDEQRLTPAMVFTSSAVSVSNGGISTPGTMFTGPGGRGIRVENGFWLHKSAAASGEANRSVIYYRRK